MKLITKHHILTVVVFFGLINLALSQTSDSTPGIDALAKEYYENVNINPQIAKKAATDWLKESKKQNIELQEVRALYALGNLSNIIGDYKSTISYTNETIALLHKLKIEKGLAACYNIIASAYKYLGDYPKAIDNFMECLSYSEKTNNKVQEANAYQNIATLYLLQKEYKKAAENLDRAANLYREIGDDDGVLTTLFNFANILKEEGKFDQARTHYQTVLGYREKEGNKAVVAYVNINLAQMLVEEGRCEEAVVALKKTLALLEEIQFTSDITIVLNDLGLCETKLGHTKSAIHYFQRALAIGEEQSLLRYNSDIYKNLAQLYQDDGNYKKALEYYQKGVTTIADQNSLDKEKYVANIQERYETQLKEARIQLLEKEQKLSDAELQKAELKVKRQRLIRNVFIIGFILVLLTLIVLRLLYIQRLRVQKELGVQQEENAKQKINQMMNDHKLSVIERYQEGQDQERERFAREIHDGIGSDLAGIRIAFEHYAENHEDKSQSKRISNAINNACIDVRSLSHQLHPLPFSKIGFTSFLSDFISQITQKSDIDIKTYFFPEEDIDQLPQDVLADAYRIVQELINNILKHAEASHVDVQLTRHTDHLNIVINDDGKGFQKNKKHGIGLRNIKERLQKVKGSLDIDSSPGHGTSITIDIPLK
ncbi:histidine kinase [Formosa agariphila KMM 3901]|uniref:Oxygen sensor histidine kinase NreB n=1 Tax=Formosa agariphila (strain DSM 15362 / KCTC 12365 / LMG 23005 / KMM 3901 / M-2Alg 35-1) TaxID=1347342 RepID=T2KNQ3_FORAG|nr:tetratricopeptide repeat protein [Formosa agariphila]CDF79624.1 histidine kinase [Formosa agariphila KMM 3901]